MPTKTMLHAAHSAHHARHGAAPGVSIGDVKVRFPAVMANKDAKVARFTKRKLAGIEAAGYDVIDARARFAGPDRIKAGRTTYRFRRGAVIATGSQPVLPPIPGIADVPYLTSDDVLRLTERPETLMVLGSGAIGLELGQFFARMGTLVTLFSRRRALSRVDADLADAVEVMLRDEPGLDLLQPECPTAFAKGAGGGIRAERQGGVARQATHLLVAAGRRALIDDLALERAGIEVEDGRIVCGPDMRTTNPRVFVAGDATDRRLLLHVANWEGQVAGRGAAAVPGQHRVEERLHMEVIFTDPPIACLGLSEEGARASGLEVESAIVQLPMTGRAVTQDVRHGIMKLVAERASGEVVGVQLFGPQADEIIHSVAAVMYYHGTVRDMARMPWYHPTHGEMLLALSRELAAKTGAATRP
jgi:pyruvate/2-oxoglutarate dehydrogenase complex dihydrolipoamide dehydrogenase (E3) component